MMFGRATTMTADARSAYCCATSAAASGSTPTPRWRPAAASCRSRYQERSYVHALQWAIGLELFLLGRDPWRVVLSTDHPNGGSFLGYPQLIRLLMDRDVPQGADRARQQEARSGGTALLDELDARVHARGDRDHHPGRAGAAARACATRGTSASAPMRTSPSTRRTPDREEMFAMPRYVIKGGRVGRRGRRAADRAGGDPAARRRRVRPRDRGDARAAVRRSGTASGSATTPVREPCAAASPRAVRRAWRERAIERPTARSSTPSPRRSRCGRARIVITAETPGGRSRRGAR